MANDWWQNAVVYQIYPKSFKDGNNDGIGDIPGIIEKLDYLAALGVTVLWLNPIFKSPQVDNGYDVSDYYSLDPLFGTDADFEALVDQAKKKGMRLILDLVMNHTSDRHPWFLEARKSRTNHYRDYYIWRDGKNQREPTNWGSFFGGSAWCFEKRTEQYYFHLFDERMPDLNWENPNVRAEFERIGAYWLGKGVDGFRLDAFIHLEKDHHFREFPNHETDNPYPIAEAYYANRPHVHRYMREFARQMRRVHPDCLLIGEAASADQRLARLYSDPRRGECDCVISFRILETERPHADQRLAKEWQRERLNIADFKQTMKNWQRELAGHGCFALYWNNHDMPRVLSRFGETRNYRRESATMLATLMYLQRGLPILFQGEELGMLNLRLTDVDAYQDSGAASFARRAAQIGWSSKKILKTIQLHSKMTSRGAIQWSDERYGGFSSVQPWLGVNTGEGAFNAASEIADSESIFSYYQALIELRTKQRVFSQGSWCLLDALNDPCYGYRRVIGKDTAWIVCNLSHKAQFVRFAGCAIATRVLGNYPDNQRDDDGFVLRPFEAVVYLQTEGKEQEKI
ncbi:MAG: alpha-glucosidase [Sporolactobacillus sp.]